MTISASDEPQPLWDDALERYQVERCCTRAESIRHRALRRALQERFGGIVPAVSELQAALKERGIAVSRQILKRDLAALGWPGAH